MIMAIHSTTLPIDNDNDNDMSLQGWSDCRKCNRVTGDVTRFTTNRHGLSTVVSVIIRVRLIAAKCQYYVSRNPLRVRGGRFSLAMTFVRYYGSVARRRP